MSSLPKHIAFCFFFFWMISLSGQIVVTAVGIQKEDASIFKAMQNCNALNGAAKEVLKSLHARGYLAARIDSIQCDDEAATVYYYQGEPLNWVELTQGNLSNEELSAIDINNRLFLNRPFNQRALNNLFERALYHFENHGYPFANIQLDSVRLTTTSVKAALKVNRSQYYSVDSIVINGNGIEKNYLLRHLGIKEGEAYNESKFKNIRNRLLEIPFIKTTKQHEVQFFENYVKLIFYIEKKKASRFDGILGLLTDEQSGELELTGDVDLSLINSFNKGENIGFNWRKLKGNSQDLTLDFGMPYFLGTAYGIDFNFKLFRRDTTFLDLNTRVGINYNIRRSEYIRLFIENKSSNLLSRDELIANTTNDIPFFGDVRMNLFGLGYALSRLDYRFNPSKGYLIDGSIAVGRKRLLKIAALEREFPNIYDDIALNTTQYNGQTRIEKFFKIANRSSILMANSSAIIYSENIYFNELLRIGGLRTLRGFDEESISASFYSISTLEYRFLLDRNSFFSLFTDMAYYEAEYRSNFTKDLPIGIGAGVSFETASGIFTINYAVGNQFDQGFDLRIAKVHFGFINFF